MNNTPNYLHTVLKGQPVTFINHKTTLASLFREVTKGLRTTVPGWERGLNKLMEARVKEGSLEAKTIPHTKTYLAKALYEENLTWKVFIQGIRLLALSTNGRLTNISFNLLVDTVDGESVTRNKYSTALYIMSPGTMLATLLGLVTKSLNGNDKLTLTVSRWGHGLDRVMANKVESGEVSKTQVAHKRSYLANALYDDMLSWGVFIDGLRVLIYSNPLPIKSLKLQLSVTLRNRKGESAVTNYTADIHNS